MRTKKPSRKSRLSRSPMKRGKAPLKRRTPLKQGKPLAQGKPLERRTPLRASRPRSRGQEERDRSEAWHDRTLARCKKVRERRRVLLVCPVCEKAYPDHQVQAHHVTPKEKIKQYVRSLRLPKDEALALLISLLWDPRNGLPCCFRCHEKHTKGSRRIRRSLLDRKHVQFATEIGLDYLLDREYV